MTHRPSVASDSNDRDMTRAYLLVLLVETVVIFALWALSRYFG
jgi:hypothetical protein